MEPVETKKVVAPKKSNASNIRVKADTRKRIFAELAKVNKKNYGRSVRPDQLLNLLLTLLRPEHIQKLQDESLSNADRLEMKYREFQKLNGAVSKDEFLGHLLAPDYGNLVQKNVAVSEEKNVK